MFELIIKDKKKLYKILNFLLLISFFWVIYINSAYFIEKIILGNTELFFDLKYIHQGFVETLSGINTYEIHPPYYNQPTTSLPPYLLYLFKNLGNLDFLVFTKYFLLLQVISIILLLYYCYSLFNLKEIIFFFPFIYFFCFNFSAGLSLTVGNIAIILYGIISLGLIYLYKNKVLIFCSLIFIVSLFKFYLIIFYFLPILIYGFKYLKTIILFLSFLLIINITYYIVYPDIYNAWINLMEIQTLRKPNNPWVGTDISHAFATITSKFGNMIHKGYYPSTLTINIFYLFVTSITFLSILIINYRKGNKSSNEKLKLISFGLLTIFLFYPRLMIYDFFIIIPVYYYLVKEITFSQEKKINALIKLTLLILFLIVQDTHSGLSSMSLLFFLICFLEYKNKNPLKLKTK
tara:strand:+ start:270 stop:1484 length:1215 start_codon:yes stop_codon:yes gene_type:complete